MFAYHYLAEYILKINKAHLGSETKKYISFSRKCDKLREDPKKQGPVFYSALIYDIFYFMKVKSYGALSLFRFCVCVCTCACVCVLPFFFICIMIRYNDCE